MQRAQPSDSLTAPEVMARHRNPNLLSPRRFLFRVSAYLLFGFSLVLISLGIGMAGYHHFAELSWIDSFYNAAMILTGMGPVNRLETDEAKLFSSFYALFSGVVFLSTVGIAFAPIAHRLMHLLHVEPDEEEKGS